MSTTSNVVRSRIRRPGIVVHDEQPKPALALRGFGHEPKLGNEPFPLLALAGEGLHAVLAGELRSVERDVGLPLQIHGRAGVVGNRRDACGDRRQPTSAPLLADGLRRRSATSAAGRGPFDDERELVAPDAEHLVLRANDAQEDAPDLAQDLVADDVPSRRSRALKPSRSK